MRESIFSVEALKREQEQADLQQKAGLQVPNVTHRKVPMNITLPIEYKNRLQEYSRKKHISASIIIQMWIDEHCV